MSEKRFRKAMGFIQDNTCKRGDIEGVMDLAEIEDMLNELYEENEQLREELSECEKLRYSAFKRREKRIENKNNCALNKDAKYPCKAYDECLKIQGTNKPMPCIVNWMMGRSFENMLRKEE